MDIKSSLNDLQRTVSEHREVLETEEAAKNALVMPFIQMLGYSVFNPSEVVPEYTADVGTKKGEKVDYAIMNEGEVSILIECKPANTDLKVEHASQLYRYFSVTDARVAILTNGVVYEFFSDTDNKNKMDDKPFFTLDLTALRSSDSTTLKDFVKGSFDVNAIVAKAGNLKAQGEVSRELQKEFSEPSDDFVRMIASRIHDGKVTAAVKDNYRGLIVASIKAVVRDQVSDRLKSALQASSPGETDEGSASFEEPEEKIITTPEEIEGFNIVRAIASRSVAPNRVVMRDAKSYCAVLLDDNNRKTIARLHFNSPTARYLGTFIGKNETRHSVDGAVGIYELEKEILDRVEELNAQSANANEDSLISSN